MRLFLSLLIALLVAAPVLADISAVSGQTANNPQAAFAQASYTLAYPNNVTSGNLLIVCGSVYNSPAPAVTVADTLTTSYTILSVVHNTTYRIFIAYGLAPSSGANTVTVDQDGTDANSFASFGIAEFTGNASSSVLDADGGSSTFSSSTTPSDGITTGTEDALVVGVMGHNGAAPTITVGGDYTLLSEYEDNGSILAHGCEYDADADAAGAKTVNWTTGAEVTGAAYTASFKEDTTATSILPFRLYR